MDPSFSTHSDVNRFPDSLVVLLVAVDLSSDCRFAGLLVARIDGLQREHEGSIQRIINRTYIKTKMEHNIEGTDYCALRKNTATVQIPGFCCCRLQSRDRETEREREEREKRERRERVRVREGERG